MFTQVALPFAVAFLLVLFIVLTAKRTKQEYRTGWNPHRKQGHFTVQKKVTDHCPSDQTERNAGVQGGDLRLLLGSGQLDPPLVVGQVTHPVGTEGLVSAVKIMMHKPTLWTQVKQTLSTQKVKPTLWTQKDWPMQ